MKSIFNVSVRAKLLGISVLVFSLLLISTLYLLNASIHNELEKVELRRAEATITRIRQSVDSASDGLRSLTAIDWGRRATARQFVTGKDTEFRDSELRYESLNAALLDHYVVLAHGGEILTSGQVSVEDRTLVSLSDETLRVITTDSSIARFIRSPERFGLSGLVAIDGHPYFLAIAPIVSTSAHEEPKGFLIFTRRANVEQLAEASSLKWLSVSFRAAEPGDMNKPFQGDTKIDSSHGHINGKMLIRDLREQPILVASFDYPRDDFDKSSFARSTFALMILTAFVIAAFILTSAINSIVLTPLKETARALSRAWQSNGVDRQIYSESSDDIRLLARLFNEVMRSLSEAYSELAQSRTDAESASLAKARFIAKVNHELLTPMNGIIGMLRVLLNAETSEAKKAYINMASKSALHLLATIKNILDFSEFETGKVAPYRVAFQLRESVMAALRTVAPQIDEKPHLELLVEFSPCIPDWLEGDPSKLKQCLVKLLENAVKFTSRGAVSISVAEVSRVGARTDVRFTVRDTGVGIPERHLEHIFAPFSQADDSISREFIGAGLGLSIARQLAELMGGSITVSSIVGEGATFVLSAPFSTALAPTTPDVSVVMTGQVALVGGSSSWTTFMSQGFSDRGFVVNQFVFEDPIAIHQLGQSLCSYDLLVFTCDEPPPLVIFDLIERMASTTHPRLAIVVPLFEFAFRERLSALKITNLFTKPVSADEIIRAVTSNQRAKTEHESSSAAIDGSPERSLRVLIADDAITNRIILRSTLEDAGHQVTCVENGVELLRALEPLVRDGTARNAFDLVLTDIQMPVMDGIRATREIREIERQTNASFRLPIIAVTAYVTSDESGALAEAGIDDILAKPLDPTKLAHTLRKWCSEGPQANSVARRAVQERPPTDVIQETQEFLRVQWMTMISEFCWANSNFFLERPPIESILNISEVFRRVGDSVYRTRLVLEEFSRSYQDLLRRLLAAREIDDQGAMSAAAHALRGLLLDISAKVSSNLAARVEMAALSGNKTEASNSIGPLVQQTLMLSRLVEMAIERMERPSREGRAR